MDVLPDAGEADRGFIGGMPAYEEPKLSADGARSGRRARTWFWRRRRRRCTAVDCGFQDRCHCCSPPRSRYQGTTLCSTIISAPSLQTDVA